MIRFIDLGKQIANYEEDSEWPRQFAFFNTVNDQFVSINGYVVFDSLADFLSEVEQAEEVDPIFISRLCSLMPDWVKMAPAPREMRMIYGFKG